jgi:hypothetical protein
VKEEKNILHTLNLKRANWIRHNLCRNCHLKHIEGKTQGARRWGRIFKQLLDDLKEVRGDWNLKKKSDRSHTHTLSGKCALGKAVNLSEETA